MNKKLLTAAVGAALSMGPMLAAQADVKVYGMAHVSLDKVSCGGDGCYEGTLTTATTTWNTFYDDNSTYISDNSSRFGVKASEDLGGGLKGVAQFEIFVDNTESGKTVNANRDNYVGLEGGFGAVYLGRRDSSQKDVGGMADLFFREQLGESRAIINDTGYNSWGPALGITGITSVSMNADSREDNSVTYVSPKLGPMTVKAQYVVPDAANSDRAELNANIRGKIGPVDAGLAYWRADAKDDTTLIDYENETGIRLAVSVPLGDFRVTALYQDVKGMATLADFDRTSWGVGASFKSGNNTFKAQYYLANEIKDIDKSGASMVAVGWDHFFSKTTVGYVAYATLSNDDNAGFALGGNGHGEKYVPALGEKVNGFSVGMRVTF